MRLIRDNPVFLREARLRRRFQFRRLDRRGRLLLGLGLVAAAVIFRDIIFSFLFLIFIVDPASWSTLWHLVVNVLTVLVVFVVPAMTATSISREREQRTFELLALTRLSAYEIFLGKWLGQQAIPALILAIGLVAAVIFGSVAGISAATTFCVFLYLFLNCAFFATIGLTCSFYAKRLTATTAAILAAAALSIGTLIVDAILRTLTDWTPFLWFNPFYVVQLLANSQSWDSDGSDFNYSFHIGLPGLPFPITNSSGLEPSIVLVSVICELGFIVASLFCMTRHYRLQSDR